MDFRIAPDVSDRRGYAQLQEPNLDVLLRVGVHRYGDALRFDSADAFEQIGQIGDRLVADRTHDGAGHLVEARWQEDAQHQVLTVGKMHTDLALPVRSTALRFGKLTSDFLERMEDVFASPERVLAKVRAGTV